MFENERFRNAHCSQWEYIHIVRAIHVLLDKFYKHDFGKHDYDKFKFRVSRQVTEKIEEQVSYELYKRQQQQIIEEMNKKIIALEDALKFQSGGPMFQQAKEEFDKLKNM